MKTSRAAPFQNGSVLPAAAGISDAASAWISIVVSKSLKIVQPTHLLSNGCLTKGVLSKGMSMFDHGLSLCC